MERLGEVLRSPVLSSALAPEIVVVQSRGMERWVSLQLARIHGICANLAFPFPNTLLQTISTRLIPDMPTAEKSPFTKDILAFRILKRLPACLAKPGFESLSQYLGDDENGLKSLQLSMRIADLFDQYQIFRPEMIRAWEAGQDDGWQSELWRNLTRGKEYSDRTQIQQKILAALAQIEEATPLLPERICIFGISYLPRYHMKVFDGLSRILNVHLFVVNPCREYWADILPRGLIRKTTAQLPATEKASKDWHLEEGNPILANLGKLGKDFFSLVQHLDADTDECFQDVPVRHLLGRIQSDILNLVDPLQIRDQTDVPSDGSIQIHSVHSPMREIEVLHDQLLAMFEAQKGLLPNDVVVMAPDIETYAPYIQAVFQSQPDDRIRIPYGVADRSARRESRLAECLIKLLELKGSRFGAMEIISLLDSPAIRQKFGLSAEDIRRIEHWMLAVGIRWGKDAMHREAMGLPGCFENTWKNGLERMILGYVMPGEDRHLYRDLLPYDAIEGSDAQILGKFLECMDRLFHYEETLHGRRTVDEWLDVLMGALDHLMFYDNESAWEMAQIRDIVAELRHHAAVAGFCDPVSFEPVRYWIVNRLDVRQSSSAFISGGVTFCSMLPMRSIPFKVVCLVGMNTDSFPRSHRPLGFDLMARHPKPGDRSSREDDKYLFLEALLSAREKLYISYVGQNIQDNSRIPPSVLISELIDYLNDGYGCPEAHIVTQHPLQAFSPEYFHRHSPLFSYSSENCRAASVMTLNTPPIAVLSDPLPLSEEERASFSSLDIGDLVEFFRNPSKYVLLHRLHIRLDSGDSIPEDHEPFGLNGLDRYRIGSDVVHGAVEGAPIEEVLRVHRAGGRFPHGSPGEAVMRSLKGDTRELVRKITDRPMGALLPPLEVLHSVNRVSLHGKIDNVYPTERMIFRFAKMRAKDLIACWIRHLLLNLASPVHYPKVSTLICMDGTWQFAPVETPNAIVEILTQWFQEGLCRPLPFFPETSYTYARDTLQRGKDRTQALIRARQIWTGNPWRPGESKDPYMHTCFRHTDPINEKFIHLAEVFFTPLFESLSDGS